MRKIEVPMPITIPFVGYRIPSTPGVPWMRVC
jgi:hypothetical protein